MENTMREKLRMLLSLQCIDEKLCESAARLGIEENRIDIETAVLSVLIMTAAEGSMPAIREIRSILGTDGSGQRLDLKKQELEFKRQSSSGDNDIISGWLEAVAHNEPEQK